MYVCSKVKNSQARTGHQRGMGGRKTDDDDTHERHTDTNKLTRHTASGLPHILSVYRAPCGGGAEKRNLLAPSPWCCKQRRVTTTYRLPVPLGTPPLLNV